MLEHPRTQGASFSDEIAHGTRLLKVELDEALGERVPNAWRQALEGGPREHALLASTPLRSCAKIGTAVRVRIALAFREDPRIGSIVMKSKICLAFCLALASALPIPVVAAGSKVDGVEAGFHAELKSILERSLESKRGIIFHVNGNEVAGVVKRVLTDAVLVANQQHATVLIRFDRIDAVALD